MLLGPTLEQQLVWLLGSPGLLQQALARLLQRVLERASVADAALL